MVIRLLTLIIFLDEDAEMTQMWLIPADSEDVEKIYNAMVQCQILNPDPNDSLSEDGKITLNNFQFSIFTIVSKFLRHHTTSYRIF